MTSVNRQLARRIAQQRPPVPIAFQHVQHTGRVAKRDAAMLAARTAGCTCQPSLYWTSGGNVLMGHRAGCVLLRSIEDVN